jgi:hypothetical protein
MKKFGIKNHYYLLSVYDKSVIKIGRHTLGEFSCEGISRKIFKQFKKYQIRLIQSIDL